MTNNFITNSEKSANLKERLQKLISASYELKFLIGSFTFQVGGKFIKVFKTTLT